MVKHIKRIRILFSNSYKWAGEWDSVKQEFSYIDKDNMNADDAVQVMIHEVDGHAFWDWAMEWRREERYAFAELANKMPPVNDYVKKYEFKKINGSLNSIYENEQHSAVTELMVHGSSYHKQLISESDLAKLKEAWKALHY